MAMNQDEDARGAGKPSGWRPLRRITAVNRDDGIAARYCARLLAVLGADVTQAAPPAGADRAIGYGGAAGEAFGRWLDGGKRLVSPAEADGTAASLAGPLALVIGGEPPAGVDSPLTLDMSAFGHHGPYASRPGSAPLMQAMSGTAHIFGAAGGAPLLAQGEQAAIMAGATAFIAAVGALFGRARGVETQAVEVNEWESALCFAEVSAIDPLGRGRVGTRLGVNRFVPTYPCGVYRSADGWIGITALTLPQWRALCGLIGRPEAGENPAYAVTWERLMRADEIDALLAAPLATRTTEEWVQLGIANRVPFSPVLDQAGLVAAPMWRGRGSFAQGDDGLFTPALPFRVAPTGVVGRPLAPVPAEPAGPLAGVRVVDFTMGWAGPLATRHLGDLGADVVKIESADFPDWWRGWDRGDAGDPPAIEIKLPFMAVNRNKRGISLDLREPDGLARARALIADADIVVDNFAPGTLAKLGFDPASLQRIRPGLISIAMGAFGASGPWSGVRGYGSTVEQASGLPFVNGFEDWPPSMQHVAYGDPIAGLYGAVAALAGLHGHAELGGADVDLSQVECLFQLGADAFVAAQVEGRPVPRRGSRRATHAPCGSFPTEGEDEWVAVAVDGAEGWRALAGVLDRADWAEDPALATSDGRNARADEIEAAVAAWTRGRTRDEAVRALSAAGVPAAPVLRGGELLDDPHLVANGFWREVDRRHIGRHWQAAPPYRLDGIRPAIRRVPPVLGEHTDEVLVEFGVAV